MADSKFIPPPDQLNKIAPKKAKKSSSDASKPSIFHEIKKVVKDSYAPDAFAQVGGMNAVVLHVVQGDATKMAWKFPLMAYLFFEKNQMPDFIEVYFRIPEMHVHLPEPESETDWLAINLHPRAIMTKDKGIPNPGDIVVVDFTDKNNFRGAFVLESLNSETPPNPGAICKAAGVFNSAPAPLNATQPTGDAQTPSSGSLTAENSPSPNAATDGVKPPEKPEETDEFFELRKAMYIISVEEFATAPEFQNGSDLVESLYKRNIFNVCFTVADDGSFIRDTDRLSAVITKLASKNIHCSFYAKSTAENYKMDVLRMCQMAKGYDIQGLYYTGIGIMSDEIQQEIDSILYDFCKLYKYKYGVFLTQYPISGFFPDKRDGQDFKPVVYVSDNFYDYNDITNDFGNANETYYGTNDVNNIYGELTYPMYNLGGINLLPTPDEPCVDRARTVDMLEKEIKHHNTDQIKHYVFDNFTFLEQDFIPKILEKVGTNDVILQKFLKDIEPAEKPEEKKDIEGTPDEPEKEEPQFNSDNPSSQNPEEAPPSDPASPPGGQCAPIGGGAMPAGDLMAALGTGAPPDPSRRFDSIPGYQDLPWTTNKDRIVNDLIIQFMNALCQAMYRRIPLTHHIFTASTPKKLRVTSTMRTAATQVRLMWDKMNNDGGENAVWKLYGSSRQWVKDVVAGWKRDRAGDTTGRAFAVASVQGDIDRKKAAGGRGHALGSAVDIHTVSHIKAEGGSGASPSSMKATQFVSNLVEATKEAGGKPVVEAYQQHVHITILL